jgi:hypothetical protein
LKIIIALAIHAEWPCLGFEYVQKTSALHFATQTPAQIAGQTKLHPD